MAATRTTIKRRPNRTGRARIAESYDVNRGGKTIAIIQRTGEGKWFWYGSGHNTLPTTFESVISAAANARKVLV